VHCSQCPYQMAIDYINQMAVKYTNIFHCKALQNLPKLGFLFCKFYTIALRWSLPYQRVPTVRNPLSRCSSFRGSWCTSWPGGRRRRGQGSCWCQCSERCRGSRRTGTAGI
jgi:hypothetical protein